MSLLYCGSVVVKNSRRGKRVAKAVYKDILKAWHHELSQDILSTQSRIEVLQLRQLASDALGVEFEDLWLQDQLSSLRSGLERMVEYRNQLNLVL